MPLPGLHEHFGQALSYEKMTAGTAALEQECAMDPAMAELRQHLLRHRISFCVFDSECSRGQAGREREREAGPFPIQDKVLVLERVCARRVRVLCERESRDQEGAEP